MTVVCGANGFEVRKGAAVLFVGKTLAAAKAFYLQATKPAAKPVAKVYRPTHFEPGDEMAQIYEALTDEQLATGAY